MVPSQITHRISIFVHKTVAYVEKIPTKVSREKNAIILIDSMGNFGVKIIGVDIDAINITEDREKFRNLMVAYI